MFNSQKQIHCSRQRHCRFLFLRYSATCDVIKCNQRQWLGFRPDGVPPYHPPLHNNTVNTLLDPHTHRLEFKTVVLILELLQSIIVTLIIVCEKQRMRKSPGFMNCRGLLFEFYTVIRPNTNTLIPTVSVGFMLDETQLQRFYSLAETLLRSFLANGHHSN